MLGKMGGSAATHSHATFKHYMNNKKQDNLELNAVQYGNPNRI